MQEFEDLIAKDGFVEHAKFGGNRYGTSKKMIEEKTKEGRLVVLDIEMEVCSFSLFLFSLSILRYKCGKEPCDHVRCLGAQAHTFKYESLREQV